MEITQKQQFLAQEADAWFKRNRSQIGTQDPAHDPVIQMLEQKQIPFSQVLEVGCSNGWRLEAIRERWNVACFGVEPSQQAILDATEKHPRLKLKQGTADALPFPEKQFDLEILGFCLYLCDREDLFRIA